MSKEQQNHSNKQISDHYSDPKLRFPQPQKHVSHSLFNDGFLDYLTRRGRMLNIDRSQIIRSQQWFIPEYEPTQLFKPGSCQQGPATKKDIIELNRAKSSRIDNNLQKMQFKLSKILDRILEFFQKCQKVKSVAHGQDEKELFLHLKKQIAQIIKIRNKDQIKEYSSHKIRQSEYNFGATKTIQLLNEMHHILVQIGQESTKILSYIDDLCRQVLMNETNINQKNIKVLMMKMQILLFVYSLLKSREKQNIEHLMANTSILNQVYQQFQENQHNYSLQTCNYIRNHFHQILQELQPFKKQINLNQIHINQLIAKYPLVLGFMRIKHPNFQLNHYYNQILTQDWQEKIINLIRFIIKACSTCPEPSQQSKSLFFLNGNNLANFFIALHELNDIQQRIITAETQNIQFIRQFVEKQFSKLGKEVNCLSLPAAKFLNYIIHKSTNLVIYAYFQVLCMIDKNYLSNKLLKSIKSRIQCKILEFKPKILRFYDPGQSQMSNIEALERDLTEKFINHHDLLEFVKEKVEDVQNEDYLFAMVNILCKKLEDESSKQSQQHQS